MLCTWTMHLDRRYLACLSCAVSLFASHVKAQPVPPPAPPPPAAPAAPDTLETPYGDTAPPAPLPAPPEAAPPTAPPTAAQPAAPGPQTPAPIVRPDMRPLGPIRARRKLVLLAELGWNGLAGFGPILAYNITPHIALDLGGGISVTGLKGGIRGRVNFLTGSFTPFVGIGFMTSTGWGEFASHPKDDPNGDPNRPPVTVDLKPSHFAQFTLGFDLIHKHGFSMLGSIGYARLLNHDNYDVVAGSLTAEERQGFNIAFKSGPVISLATGYAFE